MTVHLKNVFIICGYVTVSYVCYNLCFVGLLSVISV